MCTKSTIRPDTATPAPRPGIEIGDENLPGAKPFLEQGYVMPNLLKEAVLQRLDSPPISFSAHTGGPPVA
ncbi:hypothetical protein CTA1_12425 [Colletotrichum tanaceti]|uniref:Uncharacterized protein n=1 Tax=Colletotrichum tanaceti TaxID=1306861 RepID=A0A4U6WZV8_9PEZI|nr:hypothetical protein CTA1_12425 [Colletotrichum tanaceti]